MKGIVLRILHWYKASEPVRRSLAAQLHLPTDTCRFRPTCSEYASDAVKKYGAGRGCFLALRRVLRCGPWSKGGFDPVP
ncbi:MAG: membrane protein insertion efficiency factor YidD [Patescibacteria group bacterium]|nr:membrane protein insertion efficiency factor YidD [Patescibacteria group bacterium]